jgi:hypothetical protein
MARPPHFTLSTITIKVVVYTPAERADTLTPFLLYPFFFRLLIECLAQRVLGKTNTMMLLP